MPKRIYNAWKQEDMEDTLTKVSNGNFGFNEAHHSKTTSRRHFLGLNSNVKSGRPTYLQENKEKVLLKHVLMLKINFFSFTPPYLRKLEFQLDEKYNLHHRFNKK